MSDKKSGKKKDDDEKDDNDNDSDPAGKKKGVFKRMKSLRTKKKVNYSDEDVEGEECESSSQKKAHFLRIGSKRKSVKKKSGGISTEPSENSTSLSTSISKEKREKTPGKVKDLLHKWIGRNKQKTAVDKDIGPSTSKAGCPPSNEFQESSDESPPRKSKSSKEMKKWATQTVFPPSNELEDSSNECSPSKSEFSGKIKKWTTQGNLTFSTTTSKTDESNDDDTEYNPNRKKFKSYHKKTVLKEEGSEESDTDTSNLSHIRAPLYLGEQNNECYHCGAMHLPGRHYCCSNGRVFIPPFPKIEEPLKTYLFDINSHARNTFIRRILNYNSLFSFASIQRHRLKAAKYGPQFFRLRNPKVPSDTFLLQHFPRIQNILILATIMFLIRKKLLRKEWIILLRRIWTRRSFTILLLICTYTIIC